MTTLRPGLVKALAASLRISLDPSPIRNQSFAIPCSLARSAISASVASSGYRHARPNALRIARSAAGDGPYGFSLALRRTTPPAPCGAAAKASPGTSRGGSVAAAIPLPISRPNARRETALLTAIAAPLGGNQCMRAVAGRGPQGEPASVHASNARTNSACGTGTGLRPKPGAQPQSTSGSSATWWTRAARFLPPFRRGSLSCSQSMRELSPAKTILCSGGAESLGAALHELEVDVAVVPLQRPVAGGMAVHAPGALQDGADHLEGGDRVRPRRRCRSRRRRRGVRTGDERECPGSGDRPPGRPPPAGGPHATARRRGSDRSRCFVSA